MKRKFIRREEWERNIQPQERLTFLDSSPISDISLPRRTVAIAMHGSVTAHNAQGTIYIMRHDSNDTVLLNIDEYAFNARLDEEKSEIIGPLKTEYHHIDDMPSFMKSQAPQGLIDKIQQIAKRKLNRF